MEIAQKNPKTQFTSLAHLLDINFLKLCHMELNGKRAPGIDQVTKDDYEKNLNDNLSSLYQRLKTKSYRPRPVKRVYIPKPGSDKKRPLGIPAYEDKIVQLALAKILSAIYEPAFLDCSCGFRPNRGAHDALKLLSHVISTRRVKFVVDADIKSFFNHVDHEWMMKFLKHRIVDPSFLQLVRRILKAGCMEDGAVQATREGTPQGGNLSPVLANIYLHYVIDLWFEKVVRLQCAGEAYMVRYADDIACCFESENEARRFYIDLQERLAKFNLQIAVEKSRVIEFGRFAIIDMASKKGKKPETFDFLGFTHYCGTTQQGNFRVKRKTCNSKYRAALQRMKEWLKSSRHMETKDLVAQLRVKLRGYYQYYGITDNAKMICRYSNQINKLLFKWLNCRSQRRSYDWPTFQKALEQFALPSPKIQVNIYDRRPHIGYVS